MGGEFHDQPLGQRLECTIIFLIGRIRADRLTTRSDDGAPGGSRRWFPAGNTDITPLPHSIRAITILDRGLLARLVLGPGIAAIDRETAIPIQRDEDARAPDLCLIVDQRPLFERPIASRSARVRWAVSSMTSRSGSGLSAPSSSSSDASAPIG